MARNVAKHNLKDLAIKESETEILLDTLPHTELLIIANSHTTVIKLPFGNKFDVIDNCIIIHEKQ